MGIYTVTITGADDSVKPKDLAQISKMYPFVEWGILFPSSAFGVSRYPSSGWVKSLTEMASTKSMQLSAHMCEPYTEWLIADGKINELVSAIGIDNLPHFQRIQLNMHGQPYTAYSSMCQDAINHLTQEVIIQADGINDWIARGLKGTSILYDTSSGTGFFNNNWPRHLQDERKFGYAGGLSFKTLPQAMEKWELLDDHFWIDMESGVRTQTVDHEECIVLDYFDLNKILDVLDYMEPFVKE